MMNSSASDRFDSFSFFVRVFTNGSGGEVTSSAYTRSVGHVTVRTSFSHVKKGFRFWDILQSVIRYLIIHSPQVDERSNAQ